MNRFASLFLALIVGFLIYRFSAWRLHRTLTKNSTRLSDPELEIWTRKLAHAQDLPRIPVFIYEIDPVNGLAAPDGRIFITRGFYRKFKQGDVTGEEMASVIAHELGHVALGHARRRSIDFSGQNAMRTALAMIFSRIIPVIGPWIAGLVMNLLLARLSRDNEYEADAWAAALLHKSGIGVDAQKSLFSKLEALAKSNAGAMPAWFLSHPKTDQRIAALEKLEARWAKADRA